MRGRADGRVVPLALPLSPPPLPLPTPHASVEGIAGKPSAARAIKPSKVPGATSFRAIRNVLTCQIEGSDAIASSPSGWGRGKISPALDGLPKTFCAHGRRRKDRVRGGWFVGGASKQNRTKSVCVSLRGEKRERWRGFGLALPQTPRKKAPSAGHEFSLLPDAKLFKKGGGVSNL